MVMARLLTKMFIFLVLMVIGYGFARKTRATPELGKALGALVINVFMSASIINPVLNATLQLDGRTLLHTMLVLCLTMVLAYALATAAARLLPLPRENKGQFLLLVAVMNNMFVALPEVEELFGPQAGFYCSLSCIPFNVLLYTYGVWRLRDGGKGSFRLREMVSVPLIATFTALGIFLLEPPIPSALRELCAAVAGGTMPLSMLVIGVTLSSVSLLDAFKKRWMYLASFLRLLASPLLVFLVCRLLTDDPTLLTTAVIIAACPTGIVTTVLSLQYGRDPVFTSEGILQSTALSLVTIPLVAALLL